MKLNYDMRINIHVLVFWDFIHQTVYLESLQIVEKQVAMELNLTQQSVFCPNNVVAVNMKPQEKNRIQLLRRSSPSSIVLTSEACQLLFQRIRSQNWNTGRVLRTIQGDPSPGGKQPNRTYPSSILHDHDPSGEGQSIRQSPRMQPFCSHAVPTVLLQGAAASWRFSTACLFHQFWLAEFGAV